jgi:dolichyl-phosphate-mannose--protein O-mannosyl transferase
MIVESVPRGTVKSRFFGDFCQLNVAIWTSNNALVPDPDKFDILSSVPTELPFLSVGLRNPVVWWGATTSIGAFLTLVAIYVVRMRRKSNHLSPGKETITMQRRMISDVVLCSGMGSIPVHWQDLVSWLVASLFTLL